MEEGNLVCITVNSRRYPLIIQRRNDTKTVSIVALGCFHPVVKVQSASLHFFLGSDEEQEDSDEEEEDVSLFGHTCPMSLKPRRFRIEKHFSVVARSTKKLEAETINCESSSNPLNQFVSAPFNASLLILIRLSET